MGQDPQDPADQAGDGFRPAKVPPKIGRGVPTQTTSGGRGVPTKIANGSSGDKASFASKDKLASEDQDNERGWTQLWWRSWWRLRSWWRSWSQLRCGKNLAPL